VNGSSSTVAGASYVYDAAGLATSKTVAGTTEGYTYDNAYRLTQVTQGGSTTTESYSYDAASNRTAALGASTWTNGDRNERVSIGSSLTFTYDDNGNMLSRDDGSHVWTYEWDAENRLRRVVRDAIDVAAYAYDPLGRRVERTVNGECSSCTCSGTGLDGPVTV